MSAFKKPIVIYGVCLMLLTLALLSGCATVSSESGVYIPLEEYHADVQNRAADELEAMEASCPRTHVIGGCSAVKTIVNDCGVTREQVRIVNEVSNGGK